MKSGNTHLRRLADIRKRARRRSDLNAGFLHVWAAEIIGQRLAATNRRFTNPALLFDNPFSSLIEAALFEQEIPVDGSFRKIPYPDTEPEILALEPQSVDLAVAILDLHHMDDLPAMLMQIGLALKPDGMLMAALPVAGTLEELRQALFKAELENSGGAASRIDQFPEIRQLGDLLHRTGFKLPVADVESTTIRYSDFQDLVRDLRSGGASGTTAEKPISRQTRSRIIQLLSRDKSTEDGKMGFTVRMGFLSGWKEHQSQQTPVKPGSATHSLKDFL